MMKSQKICDECNVCDISMRAESGEQEGAGKEWKAVWERKVKCIQAWELRTSGHIQTHCNLPD